MELHRAGRTIAPDERPCIVDKDGDGHPAEVDEGGGNALAPIILALLKKRFHEETAGITEDRHQQEHPDFGFADDDAFLAESICSCAAGAVSTRTVATSVALQLDRIRSSDCHVASDSISEITGLVCRKPFTLMRGLITEEGSDDSERRIHRSTHAGNHQRVRADDVQEGRPDSPREGGQD